jgi:hypothetical protein
MKRHVVLGLFTIGMAVLPLVAAVSLITMRDMPVTNWFVLYRMTLALALLVAGILLVFAPSRRARIAALLAWGFVVADAVWGVAVLWPVDAYWPGAALNLVFLGIGVAVLGFIVVTILRSRTIKGEGIAV